jgi:hypothetical protein
MNARRSKMPGWWLTISLALLLLLVVAPATLANERVPDVSDLPLYARILWNGSTHGDGWTFVVFYRPPACVPATFNLLEMFDPAAPGCRPVTVNGFYIFEEGVPAPIQQKLHGLGAVPVWFLTQADLEAAVADGMLTMVELEDQPSLLKGAADFYTEVLHPYEAVKHSMHTLVGAGALEDGRTFRFSVQNDMVNLKFR